MDDRKDVLRDILYGIARFAVLCAVTIFASFITGTVVLAAIGNIFYNEGSVADEAYLSVIANAILILSMCALFFDDGKRHAAYSRHDTITVSITCILCMAVYFSPIMFLKYAEDDRVLKLYEWFYLPQEWVCSLVGDKVYGVLLSSIAMAVIFIVMYHWGGKIYYRRLNKRVLRNQANIFE